MVVEMKINQMLFMAEQEGLEYLTDTRLARINALIRDLRASDNIAEDEQYIFRYYNIDIETLSPQEVQYIETQVNI